MFWHLFSSATRTDIIVCLNGDHIEALTNSDVDDLMCDQSLQLTRRFNARANRHGSHPFGRT